MIAGFILLLIINCLQNHGHLFIFIAKLTKTDVNQRMYEPIINKIINIICNRLTYSKSRAKLLLK